MSEPQKHNAVRSPNYRTIFANSIGLRAGDNDFQIVFSIEHGAGENTFLEEATVALTPRTAKLLWVMLGSSIEMIEKQCGPIAIAFDPAQIKPVEIKRP